MGAQQTAGLRRVSAVRYVLPLREGGSLPGLVEADDLGTYVVKFRGAGQGTRALVAEVIVGELARRLGLPVPELVVVNLDPGLAPAEPDQEVQDLLRASPGDNLGMDFLPGSLGLDVTVDQIDPTFAAQVLWLDALVQNVDRSWRNPNLLRWHRQPWLIDHGAALYWHHVGLRSRTPTDGPIPAAPTMSCFPLPGRSTSRTRRSHPAHPGSCRRGHRARAGDMVGSRRQYLCRRAASRVRRGAPCPGRSA